MAENLPELLVVRNRQVMCRFLEGQTPEEIATHLRLKENTVRKLLRRPEIQTEIERLGKLANDQIVLERIGGLAEEAIDTIRGAMRGEVTNELKFKAAKDLLDRHPVFKEKSVGEGIGEALGEAIIFRMAQMEAEKKEIDVTPKEGVE